MSVHVVVCVVVCVLVCGLVMRVSVGRSSVCLNEVLFVCAAVCSGVRQFDCVVVGCVSVRVFVCLFD